jgi:hypothetical protein
MRTAKRPLALALLALGPLAAGCGSDFAPPSLLDDLRVLAILAEPLELGPGDEVTLRPVIYAPPGDALTGLAWSFCPFDLGPQSGYACAAPACEHALTPEVDGSVRAAPGELALACLEELGASGEPPPGLPSEPPEVLDVRFQLALTSASGDSREAVLRVPLWTRAAPASPNRAPALAGVEWDGAPAAPGELLGPAAEGDERELRVRVDPASLDSYLGPDGEPVLEEPLVSFYATAGRFAWDRDVGQELAVTWTAERLPPELGEAEVWLVTRDLRGGQAVDGPFRVPLRTTP